MSSETLPKLRTFILHLMNGDINIDTPQKGNKERIVFGTILQMILKSRLLSM